MRSGAHCFALAVLLWLGGCTSLPPQANVLPANAVAVELDDTPFFPQQRYHCGPASLAAVLTSSGVDASPEALADKVFLPGRAGSLQVEMLAATRTSARVPYQIDPGVAAIYRELRAGRPVLVLQNLGVAWWPRWHYAVVVGIDPARRTVILRSGIQRRRVTALRTFLRTWQRSDFWAFVALAPDALPAQPDKARLIAAVAALESSGQYDASATAWRTVLARWPGERVARFGLANLVAAQGEHEDAVARYRALLAAGGVQPAVRNNLALSLAALGLYNGALAEIDIAIDANDSSALDAELADTRRQIMAMQQGAR